MWECVFYLWGIWLWTLPEPFVDTSSRTLRSYCDEQVQIFMYSHIYFENVHVSFGKFKLLFFFFFFMYSVSIFVCEQWQTCRAQCVSVTSGAFCFGRMLLPVGILNPAMFAKPVERLGWKVIQRCKVLQWHDIYSQAKGLWTGEPKGSFLWQK